MNLEKITLGQMEQATMAIVPWGALEPHNGHMPYYSDCLLAQAVALDAVSRAAHPVAVLPPVWLGQQNPSQTDYPCCVHTSTETQKGILRDIVRSLRNQGFDKLLIINGHGGNSFKGVIRDLAFEMPDFTVLTTDWYAVEKGADYFEAKGEHADELETSVMLHYHPELVDMKAAGDGVGHNFSVEELNKKTAWLPRRWKSVTSDTGIGNPHGATAEKGAKFAAAIAKRIAALIDELHTHKDWYVRN